MTEDLNLGWLTDKSSKLLVWAGLWNQDHWIASPTLSPLCHVDLWKNYNVQIFWIRMIIIQRDITGPFVYFSWKVIMLENMLLGRWEKLSFSIITNPVTFMIVWPKQRENMCQQPDMSQFACSCKNLWKIGEIAKFANIGFLFANTQKITNFAAATNLDRRVKYRAELDLLNIPKTGPTCSLNYYPVDNY